MYEFSLWLSSRDWKKTENQYVGSIATKQVNENDTSYEYINLSYSKYKQQVRKEDVNRNLIFLEEERIECFD